MMAAKKIRIIIRSILVILSLILIGWSLLVVLKGKEYETITAQEGIHFISFKAKGLVIRDEKATDLAEYFGKGVVAEYAKQNGEHIEMNELMMKLYESSEGANFAGKVNVLKQQRDRLKDLTAHANNFYGSSEVLTKSAVEPLTRLIRCLEEKNLRESFESELTFVTLLNKKSLATGKESGFEKQINLLDQKITNLGLNTGRVLAMYFSDVVGCFLNYIDGYEHLNTNLICGENVNDKNLITLYYEVENKLKILKNEHNFGAKVVVGNDWYLLVPLTDTIEDSISKLNTKVNLDFGFKEGKDIPARLFKVVQTDTESFAIFKSNYMNEGLAKVRMPRVTICTNKIRGIICPISAVRFLNGEKGVFVKEGKLIRFKKLNPIFENKDIVISKSMSGSVGFLERLDEIVIHSRNLFEERAL